MEFVVADFSSHCRCQPSSFRCIHGMKAVMDGIVTTKIHVRSCDGVTHAYFFYRHGVSLPYTTFLCSPLTKIKRWDLVTYLSKDVDIIFVLGCHSGTDLSFFSFIETVLKSIWMLFEEKTKLAESSHDGASWLSRHPILLFQTKTETQMSDGPLDRYSCKSLSRDRGIRSRFGTQTMKHITYFFLCV